MDRASNGVASMQPLAPKLIPHGGNIDPASATIFCFAHCISTTGKAVVEALVKPNKENQWLPSISQLSTPFEAGPGWTPPLVIGEQSFAQALEHDPVSIGRGIVTTIRGSHLRLEAFHSILEDGNKSLWYGVKLEPEDMDKVPDKKPIQDVATRFSSTFLMIRRLRLLRRVIHALFLHPILDKFSRFQLTDIEWIVLREVQYVLSEPWAVQQILSYDDQAILSGVLPSMEQLLVKWTNTQERFPSLARIIQPGLDKLDHILDKLTTSDAYVIALFLNPGVKMDWIRKYYTAAAHSRAEELILAKASLHSVFLSVLPFLPVAYSISSLRPTAYKFERTTLLCQIQLPSQRLTHLPGNEMPFHFLICLIPIKMTLDRQPYLQLRMSSIHMQANHGHHALLLLQS